MSFSTNAMINNQSRQTEVFAPSALLSAEESTMSTKEEKKAPWLSNTQGNMSWKSVAGTLKETAAVTANIDVKGYHEDNNNTVNTEINCTFTEDKNRAKSADKAREDNLSLAECSRQLAGNTVSVHSKARTGSEMGSEQRLRKPMLREARDSGELDSRKLVSLQRENMELRKMLTNLENKIRTDSVQNLNDIDTTLKNHKTGLDLVNSVTKRHGSQLARTESGLKKQSEVSQGCLGALQDLTDLHMNHVSKNNSKIENLQNRLETVESKYDALSEGYVTTAKQHVAEIRGLKKNSQRHSSFLEQTQSRNASLDAEIRGLNETAENHRMGLNMLNRKMRANEENGKYTMELFKGMHQHAVDIKALQEKFDAKYDIVE